MSRALPLIVAAAFGAAPLPALAAAGTTPGAAQAANAVDDNRIICRRIQETGSLVKRTKQCFTKAEWDRIAAAAYEGNRKMVDQLTTRSIGN
jgi:hypothetical protein